MYGAMLTGGTKLRRRRYIPAMAVVRSNRKSAAVDGSCALIMFHVKQFYQVSRAGGRQRCEGGGRRMFHVK